MFKFKHPPPLLTPPPPIKGKYIPYIRLGRDQLVSIGINRGQLDRIYEIIDDLSKADEEMYLYQWFYVNSIDVQLIIDEEMRTVLDVINVNIRLLLYEKGLSTKELSSSLYEKEEIYGIPLEEVAQTVVQGWPERKVAEIDRDYNEAKVRMGVDDPINYMADLILMNWNRPTIPRPTKESVYRVLHLHLRTVKTRFPIIPTFVRWMYLTYFYLKRSDVSSLREAKKKAEDQLKLEQHYVHEGWYSEYEAMKIARLMIFLDDPSFLEEEEDDDSGNIDPRSRIERKEETFVF